MKCRSAWSIVAALLVTFAPKVAAACGSCRGPAGPGASVTAPWQTWGVSLSQSARYAHGVWDDRGEYHRMGPNASDRALDLTLSAGYRVFRNVELAGVLPAGHEILVAPGAAAERTAFGDAAARVRWEIVEEPAVDLPSRTSWPSFAMALGLRIPTGTVDRASGTGAVGSSGTVGSSAVSQGLGAWEAALSFDTRRTFSRWQVGLVGEGALRLPDSSLGIDRALGPRLLGRALVLRFLTDDWTMGVFTDLAYEGDVSYEGRRVPATSQRAWSVGAMSALKLEAGLRAGVSLTVIPPVQGVGINVVGTTQVGLFLGYAQ